MTIAHCYMNWHRWH